MRISQVLSACLMRRMADDFICLHWAGAAMDHKRSEPTEALHPAAAAPHRSHAARRSPPCLSCRWRYQRRRRRLWTTLSSLSSVPPSFLSPHLSIVFVRRACPSSVRVSPSSAIQSNHIRDTISSLTLSLSLPSYRAAAAAMALDDGVGHVVIVAELQSLRSSMERKCLPCGCP